MKHSRDIIIFVKKTNDKPEHKVLRKIGTSKTNSSKRQMSLYANLANKHRLKKDQKSRKKAEYLASLPKHPVRRLLYRIHPKRVFSYWFSKKGAFMALKILGVAILLAVIMVGGLFAYFRKDLDKIRPGEIAKRVQTTVTRYYDKNNVLLWEDKGTDSYKLVVDSKDISDYIKKATVAVEDKDFYRHHGVSVSGMARAFISNTSGGQVQGGSTLTQQLVKQVFFADEAGNRGLNGIPRKIKEIILSIEVERMYNKDQILTLYLNESPYGGRRNGVESASQTYFGKKAKDLNLAESALLASIPQNPSLFNPYNLSGRKGLISRQHIVLDYMVEQGYVDKKSAEEAKKYPIFDNLKPLSNQLDNIKAPHFVLMVRSQLEKELGRSVVGRGGLTVKTTLDWRIQEKLEKDMKSFFDSGRPGAYNIGNGAATIEDTQTGQIVALVGSRDFNYPGYGQDNASIAYIQPGSSIKPLVFAELFKDKGQNQQNFGSGSILADDNIDKIYGAKLYNWDKKFMGAISIRRGLALSRNVPAVKAMYISGVEKTIKTVREMGSSDYCKPEQSAAGGALFLSSAIGACGSKQTQMTNAYGTLARMGVAKSSTSIIEVKNNQGDTLKKWKDDGKQVIDPQVAYILNDILADTSNALHGTSLSVPGVRTAAKTGTSDKNSVPKDIWIMSYSPALVMSLWLGNPDTSTISTPSSAVGAPLIRKTMAFAHNNVYAKDGKWHAGMWFNRPSGIQQVGRELYPSWWNKKQGYKVEKLAFDKISKKRASSCTPDKAKEELEIKKMRDPITKRDSIIAPPGYDATKEDDVHSCDDAKPQISGVSISSNSSGVYTISATISNGKFNLESYEILVDGKPIKSGALSASGGKVSGTVKLEDAGSHSLTINATDQAYYVDTHTRSFSSD